MTSQIAILAAATCLSCAGAAPRSSQNVAALREGADVVSSNSIGGVRIVVRRLWDIAGPGIRVSLEVHNETEGYLHVRGNDWVGGCSIPSSIAGWKICLFDEEGREVEGECIVDRLPRSQEYQSLAPHQMASTVEAMSSICYPFRETTSVQIGAALDVDVRGSSAESSRVHLQTNGNLKTKFVVHDSEAAATRSRPQ